MHMRPGACLTRNPASLDTSGYTAAPYSTALNLPPTTPWEVDGLLANDTRTGRPAMHARRCKEVWGTRNANPPAVSLAARYTPDTHPHRVPPQRQRVQRRGWIDVPWRMRRTCCRRASEFLSRGFPALSMQICACGDRCSVR